VETEKLLLGIWVSVDADGQRTTIEFRSDGRLDFTFQRATKDQTMFLTYTVQGNILVTNQPSNPRQERTQFDFTNEGELVLTYDSVETVYTRL
jgi:hypothetical protein